MNDEGGLSVGEAVVKIAYNYDQRSLSWIIGLNGNPVKSCGLLELRGNEGHSPIGFSRTRVTRRR